MGQLKSLFTIVQDAPENIREYLQNLFWVLVFLTLIWMILKLLFNKDFKKLYRVLGKSVTKAGVIAKTVSREAAKNLELPEPYPQLTKFFAFVFITNSYLASLFFALFFLTLVGVLATTGNTSFIARTLGFLITLVCGYFSWFLFVQAERDRVLLFRKSVTSNGEQDAPDDVPAPRLNLGFGLPQQPTWRVQMATDSELKAIVTALEDKRFKWRTIRGVVVDAGLPEKTVVEGLETLRNSGLVIRPSAQSSKGEDLFTTRKHYKQFAPLSERLAAVLRNRAS